MKAIWIDFSNPIAPKFRLLRALLIVLGMLLFVYTSISYKQIDDETTALTLQREHLNRSSAKTAIQGQNQPETEASRSELKIAEDIRNQLNTPWEKLFEGLESAVTSSVKIISIRANPSKKMIGIKVSVPNIQTAINFTERLQSGDQLSEVRISSQEIDPESDEGFLQATISAVWDSKYE
jgi:hypothetical protein